MYYLETNAISHIKLETCSKELLNESYTSSFAILEMLKGINKDNYSTKRKIIKSLNDSKIPIMWELPIIKIATCFPLVEDFKLKSNIENLKLVYYMIIENDSYSDALNKFIKVSSKGFHEIDHIYETYQGYLSDFFLAKEIHENLKIVSSDILAFVCRCILESVGNRQFKDEKQGKRLFLNLYTTYNKKADIFFKMVKSYIQRYLTKDPHKNDLIDLLHFCYLENNSCKFVTNDKKFLKLANEERKIAFTCTEYIGKRC